MKTKNLWYSLFATIFALFLLVVTAFAAFNFVDDLDQYDSYTEWSNKGFIYTITETVNKSEYEDGTILVGKCHLTGENNANILDLNGNELIAEAEGTIMNQEVTFDYVFDLSNISDKDKKFVYNNCIRPLPLVIITIIVTGILGIGFIISIIIAIIYYRKYSKLNKG